MLFRRSRARLRSSIALAMTLLLQVSTLGPAAASVIYCIGSDGHAGFELLQGGVSDCDPCCSDDAEAPGGEVALDNADCTDIALSTAAAASAKHDGAAAAPFVATLLPAAGAARCDGNHRLCVSPARPPNEASKSLRSTVLRI